MDIFFAILLACVLGELFRWVFTLGIHNTILSVGKKAGRVVSSRTLSDDSKELAVGVYAQQMMLATVKMAGSFFLIVAVGALLLLPYQMLGGDVGAFLASGVVLVVMTVASIAYIWIRQKYFAKTHSDKANKGHDGDYSAGAKLLHKIALDNQAVPEMSWDIEQSLLGETTPAIAEKRHVFISGLARAGTTVLTRRLYATGAFLSLTYRDMPFVMMPNMWRNLRGKPTDAGEKKERAHGDGLLVDHDSPEALEEVFWRVLAGDAYIKEDCLVPMLAGQELIEQFRTYIAAILKPNRSKRYLSKNNNSILRLGSITAAFPNAIILIPFREPLQQAYSLLQQHQRFDGSDAFTAKYMRWLAHHEFGDNQRPFVFKKGETPQGDPSQLDYWLQLWSHVYGWLLQNAPEQVRFISYRRLCENPACWDAIVAELELPVNLKEADVLNYKERTIEQPHEASFLEKARSIYQQLEARSFPSN